MRDDEFILDKCDFDEIEKPEDKNAPKSPKKKDADKLRRQSLKKKGGSPFENNKEYIQINDEYLYFIFSPLRAYSMQWPYVALSGLSNYVLIVNAYDRKFLRRVQVAERNEQITIS